MDYTNPFIGFEPAPLSAVTEGLFKYDAADEIPSTQIDGLRKTNGPLFHDVRNVTIAYAILAGSGAEVAVERVNHALNLVFGGNRVVHRAHVPAWALLFDVIVMTSGDDNRPAYNAALTDIVNTLLNIEIDRKKGVEVEEWAEELAPAEMAALYLAISGGASGIARPPHMTRVLILFAQLLNAMANRTRDETIVQIAETVHKGIANIRE